MPDFLPRRQVDLLNWSSAFKNQIGRDPSEYDLTEAQSEEYALAHDAFAVLYRAATDPATGSRSLTLQKDAALVRLKEEARKLARILRANPAITRVQLIQLGLSPTHDNGPADLAQLGAPTVQVVAIVGRTVRLRLSDPAAATRIGKPAGIVGAAIYFAVCEQEPKSTDEWTFIRNTTRPTTAVTFGDQLRPGTKVWITVSWLDGQLQPGRCARPRYAYLGYAASVHAASQLAA